jgi:GGDEF domain-containing protein
MCLANFDLTAEKSFEHQRFSFTGLGTSVVGVLLVLGLDRYQRIRDLHGSRSGDQIIKDVAERLQHSPSACTTITHYGGPE